MAVPFVFVEQPTVRVVRPLTRADERQQRWLDLRASSARPAPQAGHAVGAASVRNGIFVDLDPLHFTLGPHATAPTHVPVTSAHRLAEHPRAPA